MEKEFSYIAIRYDNNNPVHIAGIIKGMSFMQVTIHLEKEYSIVLYIEQKTHYVKQELIQQYIDQKP